MSEETNLNQVEKTQEQASAEADKVQAPETPATEESRTEQPQAQTAAKTVEVPSWTNDRAETVAAKQEEGKKKEKKTRKAKAKKEKTGGFWKKAVAAVVLAVLFGGAAGGTFYGICKYTGLLDREVQAPVIVEKPKEVASEVAQVPAENQEIKLADTDKVQVVTTDISEMVEKVMPAMVTILNTSENSTTNMWGQTYTWQDKSSGTGIIIAQNETELLLVTNHHVAESADTLEITFIDGSTAHAKVKGMDSEMDLAVLAIPLSEIEQETKDTIVIARMGDSNHLKLGQPTIVVGNALGYGISVTDGVVSGLEREMTLEDGSVGTFIQTSAAVNHGNSGGALLNIQGEVIGIVSNKIDGYGVEGMGYAIPISEASPVIAELMDRQTREEKVPEEEMGYLGVTLQNVTAEAKAYYNMPDGISVYEVSPGSAAEKAGILRGDIIVKVEGEKVSTYESLRAIMDYYRVGQEIKITVNRLEKGDYVPYEFTVVLGEKPAE